MNLKQSQPNSIAFDQYYQELFSIAMAIVHSRTEAHLVLDKVKSNHSFSSLEDDPDPVAIQAIWADQVRMVSWDRMLPMVF